jgi:hypothetical protein
MVFWHNWQESITLLKPNNFTLFTLVTLKSIISCYKLLARFFWWFLPLTVWILVASHRSFERLEDLPYKLVSVSALCVVWLFMVLLATRPSTAPKNVAYFTRYCGVWSLLQLLVAFFGACIPGVFLDALFSGARFWLFNQGIKTWTAHLPLVLLGKIIPMSVVVFALLFAFDKVRNPIKNAFVMLWHNWPMIIVLEIAFGLLFYGHSLLLPVMQNAFGSVALLLYLLTILFVLMPIYICTMTNVYIKKVHEQSRLYLGSGQE